MNSNDPLMGMADSMLKIREMEAVRMKEAIAEFHNVLDKDTYKGMTIDHLGDMATEAHLEYFRSACEAYQRRTGCSDIDATDYIWGDGDWLKRAFGETNFMALVLYQLDLLKKEEGNE